MVSAHGSKMPCRSQHQQMLLLSLRWWKLRRPSRSRCPRRRRRGGPRRPQPMARSQVGQLTELPKQYSCLDKLGLPGLDCRCHAAYTRLRPKDPCCCLDHLPGLPVCGQLGYIPEFLYCNNAALSSWVVQQSRCRPVVWRILAPCDIQLPLSGGWFRCYWLRMLYEAAAQSCRLTCGCVCSGSCGAREQERGHQAHAPQGAEV